MKHHRLVVAVLGCMTLVLSTSTRASAQDQAAFPKEAVEAAKRAAGQQPGRPAAAAPAPAAAAAAVLGCRGPISQVVDVGFEGLRFTPAVYGSNPGGGQGGQFDKTPVLTTKVTLADGVCLDAHVSAIVGSAQAYGVSRLTLFQVTLTPANGGPRHMVGHYETPYGKPSPAVALEPERDVDMYSSNFFQRVGKGAHEVPPGNYQVDVWWAGGPNPGGAIGAAFVLKLYLR